MQLNSNHGTFYQFKRIIVSTYNDPVHKSGPYCALRVPKGTIVVLKVAGKSHRLIVDEWCGTAGRLDLPSRSGKYIGSNWRTKGIAPGTFKVVGHVPMKYCRRTDRWELVK